MKLTEITNIDWNKAPYSTDNKISRQVRNAICKRFEFAMANLRENDEYNELSLKDGWVITAKDNIVFILNPDKNEDIPNNPEVKVKIEFIKLRKKLAEARDAAFDLEKYSELFTEVKGLTLDAATGKISFKVL